MRSPETNVILEARDITKSFNGVRALKGASLTLRAGEVHGLNGENGAGKSTLIKIITGFYQQDGGEVLLDGRPVRFQRPKDSQAAGISTVYQEVNLIPERTVAENILLGREPRRAGFLRKRAAVAEAQAILDRFGLGISARATLSSLSLGMQQMVAIVRAVAFEASAVILDEPTSALNGTEIDILFGVVRQLRDEGLAIMLVSHRMSELYELCDRFTVLRDGRFVLESTPAQLPPAELVAAMLGGIALNDTQRDPAQHRERMAALDDGDTVLDVEGLTWGNRLHDVSFAVRRGEIVGLLGLLGSGRTEICKAVYGAIRPDRGTIRLEGTALTRSSPARSLRAGIAYLSEDRRHEGIFPGLSVRENLTAAVLGRLSTFGVVRPREQSALVSRFADELRLKAAGVEQPISELSGGNQQKVLLARWIATEPKVVLLDDPTRGIDVGAKAEVHRVVRSLAERGIGVLVTSSETEELLALCDRLVVLSEGAVVGELDPLAVDPADVVGLLSAASAGSLTTTGGNP
ncbi:sugar ABC transporter ATP-binding protein [Microbacterium sp. PF5]|uniref:sugar ABC transporter ATP-binding protein n=1 Tax=Microbacterium sp. PF5 TaxID=2305435 RepID=UPI00109B965C|nr:sugar ABC transporter ATP-binding protein [Microbacterium sp. PF5]